MFTKGGVRDRLPIQKRRLQLPLFWHWLSRQSRIMYSSDGQPTAHQSLSPTLPVQPTPPRKMWRFTQSGRNATTISRHPVWRLRQARSNSTAKWPSSSDWIVGTETYHMRITLTDGSTYKAGVFPLPKKTCRHWKPQRELRQELQGVSLVGVLSGLGTTLLKRKKLFWRNLRNHIINNEKRQLLLWAVAFGWIMLKKSLKRCLLYSQGAADRDFSSHFTVSMSVSFNERGA